MCGVKPHVLRYWEQEFTQLRPMKRRGNRRYYQHHEVLLVRRIRDLLYEQGFTISGARNRLGDAASAAKRREMTAQVPAVALSTDPIDLVDPALASTLSPLAVVRAELEAALVLLDVASASSAETT